MEENKKESLFSVFDFTAEDVDRAVQEAKEVKGKSRLICICGHADGFHDFSTAEGKDYCTANKQNCKCRKKKLVLEAENTRLFLRKTTGPGVLHALAQGIRAAEQAGQDLKWIIDPACEACGSMDGLSPAPISERGVILYEDKGLNALLCAECRRTR